MDDMYKFIETKNQKELLRVCENDLKNAKNDKEKSHYESEIASINKTLSSLH